MKPVLILQHLSGDGPAYLAQWLAARGVAFEVVDSQAGQAFPGTLAGHGALAILGGEMSANDDLPSLRRAEALFLEAVRDAVPTLGHCLGGQLMSKALGGSVGPSPAPEIGWQPIDVLPSPEAQAWFGAAPRHTVFQWHYEAFTPPPGALPLATSVACPQQAWSLGPHLAMQFHVELDLAKLRLWLREEGQRYRDVAQAYSSVQGRAAMIDDASVHMAAQQALADRIYARWLGAPGSP